MKYYINAQDWENGKDCGTYDTHINILKMNIKKCEDMFGCCNPETLREIIANQIQEIVWYLETHRDTLSYNSRKLKKQLDSLNNIIDDLSIYLKKT